MDISTNNINQQDFNINFDNSITQMSDNENISVFEQNTDETACNDSFNNEHNVNKNIERNLAGFLDKLKKVVVQFFGRNFSSTIPSSKDDTDNIETGVKTRNKQIDNYKQNSVQDCWFLSALSALSSTEKGSEIIKDSIKYTDNGYEITFKGLGQTYTVTNKEIAEAKSQTEDDNTKTHTEGDDDVIAMELALEKLSEYLEQNKINVEGNSGSLKSEDILNGNSPDFAMKILGVDTDTKTEIMTSSEFNKLLQNDEEYLNNEIMGIFCSYSNTTTTDSEGNTITLNKMHTYAIQSISKENSTVTLINPWDTTEKLTLSIDTVKDLINDDDVSIKTYSIE